MSRRDIRVTVLARKRGGNKIELTAAIVTEDEGLDTPEFAVARLAERLLEETERRGLKFLGLVTTSRPVEQIG